jgi:hypothetical protein
MHLPDTCDLLIAAVPGSWQLRSTRCGVGEGGRHELIAPAGDLVVGMSLRVDWAVVGGAGWADGCSSCRWWLTAGRRWSARAPRVAVAQPQTLSRLPSVHPVYKVMNLSWSSPWLVACLLSVHDSGVRLLFSDLSFHWHHVVRRFGGQQVVSFVQTAVDDGGGVIV